MKLNSFKIPYLILVFFFTSPSTTYGFDEPLLGMNFSQTLVQFQTPIFAQIPPIGIQIGNQDDSDEDELSIFFGRTALCVSSGTSALHLSLQAAGIGAGDEVLVQSLTYLATFQAISATGARPVACDINPESLCIDSEDAKKRITSKTKAIVPVHYSGGVGDLNEIYKLAEQHKLRVVEDAAQALGSKYKGKYAGTFGLASTISLYPAKILGCFGDGGLILTNNKKLFSKLHKIRSHGINEKTKKIDHWGFNSRLDNLQAAFLSFFFKKHNENINRRRNLAKIYHKELSGLKTIKLPPTCEDKINYDIFQNYEIICEKRNKLKSFLDKKGIGTLIQWNGVKTNSLSLPNINKKKLISDSNFNKLLLLPMNISLKDSDVKTVCNEIKNFYK